MSDEGDQPIHPEVVGGGLPDLGALGDLGGLGDILDQAQKAMEAQQSAALAVIEGHAGGGAVRIEATGGGEFISVTIAPEAVDPNDVEMLQDLVLAALHDISARVGELQREAMSDMLGGLDIGGLFGGGSQPDD
jgi:DNA-binding YbaB/EbfC family protein